MNKEHLHTINAETLHQFAPAIREAWRTDNLKVFLAMLIRDSLKQGINYRVVIASAVVLTLEWLNGYLEKNHKATASIDDSIKLIESLMRESIILSLEIS